MRNDSGWSYKGQNRKLRGFQWLFWGKTMDDSRKSGTKEESASDESRFNETLKRMLRTPPKPHEKAMPAKPTKPKTKD
jgi:hypothetical protein